MSRASALSERRRSRFARETKAVHAAPREAPKRSCRATTREAWCEDPLAPASRWAVRLTTTTLLGCSAAGDQQPGQKPRAGGAGVRGVMARLASGDRAARRSEGVAGSWRGEAHVWCAGNVS